MLPLPSRKGIWAVVGGGWWFQGDTGQGIALTRACPGVPMPVQRPAAPPALREFLGMLGGEGSLGSHIVFPCRILLGGSQNSAWVPSAEWGLLPVLSSRVGTGHLSLFPLMTYMRFLIQVPSSRVGGSWLPY